MGDVSKGTSNDISLPEYQFPDPKRKRIFMDSEERQPGTTQLDTH
jgi:hypothetical protein